MANKQRYFTAGVTIAAAAATAHLMQQANERNPDGPPAAVSNAAIASPALVANPIENLPKRNQVTIVTAPEPVEEPKTQKIVIMAPELAPAEDSIPKSAAIIIKPLPDTSEVDGDVQGSTDAAADGDASPSEPLPEDGEVTGSLMPLGFPAPPRDVKNPDPLPVVGIELAQRLESSVDTPVASATEQEPRSQFGMACGPIMSAAPLPDGLVNLIMVAPCRPSARFDISHGALRFSGQTDKLGSYEVTVPALAKEAEFTLTFTDGETVSAMASSASVDGLERVAIVAPADASFQLHALEFGASYGDAGHVWAENPGEASLATTDGTGYLMQLGDVSLDNAMLAEVYTFPSQASSATGVVRLSVEAPITASNCGTDAIGQTVEMGPDGIATSVGVTVSVPDCAAIGQYLVLKNILRDLRIASSN